MGKPGRTMYCQNCGSQNADGARFCGKCHAAFGAVAPPPPPPQIRPPAPPPLPPPVGRAAAAWQSKLPPQAYEHPSDTSTLDALQHTAGLETLVRKLNAWGFER